MSEAHAVDAAMLLKTLFFIFCRRVSLQMCHVTCKALCVFFIYLPYGNPISKIYNRQVKYNDTITFSKYIIYLSTTKALDIKLCFIFQRLFTIFYRNKISYSHDRYNDGISVEMEGKRFIKNYLYHLYLVQ